MKTMTCNQLGGACDEKFRADTFEEIAELSKQHAMRMFSQGDQAHIAAGQKMKDLMQNPIAMREWFEARKVEFDELHED